MGTATGAGGRPPAKLLLFVPAGSATGAGDEADAELDAGPENYRAFWDAAAEHLGVLLPDEPTRVRFYAFGPNWELVPLAGDPGRGGVGNLYPGEVRRQVRRMRVELAPFLKTVLNALHSPAPSPAGVKASAVPSPETIRALFAEMRADEQSAAALPPRRPMIDTL